MKVIPTITAEEVRQKVESGQKIELIDVREEEEVAEGMIPQAEHIVMGTIPENLDRLDKETEYIIICRSGKRSENVSRYLIENGYKATNMTGGMLDYTGEIVPK
ncbi:MULTISPECIES: rhodanese-like domain-containing protein [Bacillaceae]|uniref:Sulfurtransferase n=1 Tax=Domibacillus aminovorans TaxID=29332 RepID=A0A177LA36_9BACI|nr:MULTISPECIES: rhodanese-like domain-containing protein [Bacillaceae]OAH56265.1 sulfurtransferase [Domibacillus aminovorans]OAH62588.1 sulfurtransferase [Domibacillus aminovorans]